VFVYLVQHPLFPVDKSGEQAELCGVLTQAATGALSFVRLWACIKLISMITLDSLASVLTPRSNVLLEELIVP